MAQVSRGERQTVTAKIPVRYAPILEAHKKQTGVSNNDLIERLLCDFLDKYDTADNRQQEFILSRAG